MCLSVLVARKNDHVLVAKGAPESIIAQSTAVESGGMAHSLDETWQLRLTQVLDRYSGNGFRLLAVATKSMPPDQNTIAVSDETDLTLVGFCVFADPAKRDAADAVMQLSSLGVNIKVVDLFSRIDPDQKRRIVSALRRRNHVVGFLGDGVNDAPAIHAAHIGLSVTGATEVARAAADMILLATDLSVLAAWVREGRRTFANILKYVRMGTSSNFGNMLSMALASIALPFLPLLPLQILLNNLLYDSSEVNRVLKFRKRKISTSHR